MNVVAIWIHEARRVGPAALSLPMLVSGGITVLAVMAHAAAAASTQAQGVTMVRLVADAFPLAAGLAAATVVGRERMIELQLTVLTAYPRTVRRRVTVLALVVLVAAVGCLTVLEAQDQWVHPAHGPLALLVPAGPVVLLVGGGAWAAMTLGSSAGASTTVVGLWLAQLLVFDRVVGLWQLNRTLLIVAGLALFAAALRRLGDSERTLGTTGRDEP